MNMKHVSVITAALSLIIVLAVAYWSSSNLASPGPLAPAHDRVPELRDARGCRACHGEDTGQQRMADACAACHEVIERQIAEGAGIHGGIDAELAPRCDRCHFEHVGDAIPLVSSESFGQAGIGSIEDYRHEWTPGFDLTGKHAELGCERCHVHAHELIIGEGQQRFLGLTQDCVSCHESPHDPGLEVACAVCHGQSEPFDRVAEFEHPDTFPLVDGHAAPKCTDCHAGKTFESISTDCASCHTDDYNLTTDPDHLLLAMSVECIQCHTTRDWTVPDYEHPEVFALTGRHGDAACADCHNAGTTPAQAVLGSAETRSARGCAACHETPHNEALSAQSVIAFAGANPADACALCHLAEDDSFAAADGRMTPALHELTGFSLAAPHDSQACADCHERDAGGYGDPRAFHAAYPGRAQDDCQACHEDPHLGQFLDGPTGGRCVECHRRTEFTPSRFDLEMHAVNAFPLTGAHRAVACVACHEIDRGAQRFAGTTGVCADCHEDIHRGRFDDVMASPAPGGGTGCARCHNTGSFNDVRWSAEEHDRLAGYALIGAHAGASCRDCHTDRSTTVASFAAASTSCADCHTDIHQGQFRVDGVTDCAACHQDFVSFRTIAFDHQNRSRFPLDEDHRTLDCAACHRVYESDYGPVTRYRPLGIRCQDCHDARGLTGAGTP
ncbi:MAG: cytochrome c3 family protein [Phycisphaeraceae bacterium]|nr:cytochrome c3 family protein [Phycisphaeraceae bacterium]MCB9847784.1 cytochrome c3 family protein [Phycisphaeraceae bacterium]